MVAGPPLAIAPPLSVLEFPVNVLWLTVSVPELLRMAPPLKVVVFPVKVQLFTVNVALASFKIPPPPLPVASLPLAIVSAFSVTVLPLAT